MAIEKHEPFVRNITGEFSSLLKKMAIKPEKVEIWETSLKHPDAPGSLRGPKPNLVLLQPPGWYPEPWKIHRDYMAIHELTHIKTGKGHEHPSFLLTLLRTAGEYLRQHPEAAIHIGEYLAIEISLAPKRVKETVEGITGIKLE